MACSLLSGKVNETTLNLTLKPGNLYIKDLEIFKRLIGPQMKFLEGQKIWICLDAESLFFPDVLCRMNFDQNISNPFTEKGLFWYQEADNELNWSLTNKFSNL